MYNALIVVYRESFEALLVVGLLYSFLVKKKADSKSFRYLTLGTIVGILLSAGLGYFIHVAESEFEGLTLEVFQLVMMSLAVVLMTHMCIWMRSHGRNIKMELETQAQEAISGANKLSLVGLTAIAIGREGSETVIFLYSLFTEAQQNSLMTSFVLLCLAGLVLGFATWWAFQKGFKYFSQKTYFHISSLLLFMTSGALVVQIVNKLHELRWLPVLVQPIWDTSEILDEGHGIGSVFSLITGYRSQPTLMVVLAYLFYWILAMYLYKADLAEVKLFCNRKTKEANR